MEKIKELLEKIGASQELSAAICEHLERYTNDVKTKHDRELQEKVERAKQICVEEVAREKANLARKVQIFLESKSKAIEQAMARQRVAEDTEATAKLKKAKALLEDIEIEGGASSRELLTLQKKAERLEKALGTIREERNRAVEKANRANSVAVKFLKKNQLLEGKLVEAGILTEEKGGEAKCECGAPIGEGVEKCPKCGKTVVTGKEEKAAKAAAEDKKATKKPITEDRLAKRLSAMRKEPSQPRSTRRTLVESQIPRSYRADGSPDITKIASDMSE